jgi:hypothetical protein
MYKALGLTLSITIFFIITIVIFVGPGPYLVG